MITTGSSPQTLGPSLLPGQARSTRATWALGLRAGESSGDIPPDAPTSQSNPPATPAAPGCSSRVGPHGPHGDNRVAVVAFGPGRRLPKVGAEEPRSHHGSDGSEAIDPGYFSPGTCRCPGQLEGTCTPSCSSMPATEESTRGERAQQNRGSPSRSRPSRSLSSSTPWPSCGPGVSPWSCPAPPTRPCWHYSQTTRPPGP